MGLSIPAELWCQRPLERDHGVRDCRRASLAVTLRMNLAKWGEEEEERSKSQSHPKPHILDALHEPPHWSKERQAKRDSPRVSKAAGGRPLPWDSAVMPFSLHHTLLTYKWKNDKERWERRWGHGNKKEKVGKREKRKEMRERRTSDLQTRTNF